MGADQLDLLYPEHLRTSMRRADQALGAAGFDALVIHAGRAPVQFLDDPEYPFKPNPHFKAWVPVVDTPHCVLIHRPGDRPKLLFHQPSDYWHKPSPIPQESWTRELSIVPVQSSAETAGHWAKLGKVAFVGPPEAFGDAEREAVNPPELLTRLHYERALKTDYEIECMRRANALGARGHVAALSAFLDGKSEYGAHLAYLDACSQREEEMPYNNIVAYNEHAAILHYQRLERTAPQPRLSLLLDAGAQYRGYAADITRSHAAAPGAYADLITELERAQRALCAEIVPGRDYRDVHLSAHRALGDLLHRVGLTNLPGQAAMERGVTSVFFPHGIGHLLGLQVHDVGGVREHAAGHERKRPEGHPYLRLTRLLEPGVVVTVEPGIYFIDSLLAAAHADARREHIDWTLAAALKPYGGIRIEDNVVTTAAGPENLTRDAFSRLSA